MNRFVISKFKFDKDNYMSEWSSISDVGKTFNGKILCYEEYVDVEKKYLDLVEQIILEENIEYFKIKKLEKYEPILWKNNQILTGVKIREFCRDCLREKCWGELSWKKTKLSFGFDYCIILEIDESYEYINGIVNSKNLFCKKLVENYDAEAERKPDVLDNRKILSLEIDECLYEIKFNNRCYLITKLKNFLVKDGKLKINCIYWLLSRKKKNNNKCDEVIYNVKIDNDLNVDTTLNKFIEIMNIKYNCNIDYSNLNISTMKKRIKICFLNTNGKVDSTIAHYEKNNDGYFIELNDKMKYLVTDLNEFVKNIII